MSPEEIALLVRLAGLEKALAEFPDDVAAAIANAMQIRSGFAAPTDPAEEPWPPMRPGTLS
jgi:hypothetical protein